MTYSPSELTAIKAVKPPGLHLLGFKPLSCLRDWHQYTHSHFMYPYEKQLKGSATAFSALHLAMHSKKKMALCR